VFGTIFYFDPTPWHIKGFAYLFTAWWIHDYGFNILYLIYKPENIKPRKIWTLNTTGVERILEDYHPEVFLIKCILLIGTPVYFTYLI
jgi:hypothetical protein